MFNKAGQSEIQEVESTTSFLKGNFFCLIWDVQLDGHGKKKGSFY